MAVGGLRSDERAQQLAVWLGFVAERGAFRRNRRSGPCGGTIGNEWRTGQHVSNHARNIERTDELNKLATRVKPDKSIRTAQRTFADHSSQLACQFSSTVQCANTGRTTGRNFWTR